MPQVYVANEQKFWRDKALVPQFDFTDARRYGDVKILEFTSQAFNDQRSIDQSIGEMNKYLADFKEDDYLLAVGDPMAITMAAGILCRRFKCVKVLKWDRHTKSYFPMRIKL